LSTIFFSRKEKAESTKFEENLTSSYRFTLAAGFKLPAVQTILPNKRSPWKDQQRWKIHSKVW